ncbi:hypothetical protein FNV43_RR19300 [Rhamnella rubrinervis]|uniref:Mitofilin n=1 Tax=Rhamnella rubrinervis TaxID=2594499 RepID=A0A8K0E7P5_9ROSA|nr:hypothetical protein FNV43_RR19300 [Rhamnella rubrinervis]
MLLRSILEFSSRRAVRRIPGHVATQIPRYFRKELSTIPQKNASPEPGSSGKPPESSSSMSKVVIGSAAVGVAILVAYQTGYVDQILGRKEHHDSPKAAKIDDEKVDVKDVHHSEDKLVFPNSEDPNKLSSTPEQAEKVETLSDVPHVEGEVETQMQDKLDTKPGEGAVDNKEKDLLVDSQSSSSSLDQISNSGISHGGSLDVKSTEANTNTGLNEEVQSPQPYIHGNSSQEENEMKSVPPPHFTTQDRGEDVIGKDTEPPNSLLEAYHLGDKPDESIKTFLSRQGRNDYEHFPNEKEAFVNAFEELNDAYITKDGKLILDFLQAIHAAEKGQAELDALVYTKEKKALKDKYEKELKDAAARELMHAEEAAMLDKELKRERAKAAAALRSLQQKLEEKLKTELEQKESEAELKLKKAQELAKAEQAALIASEKAAQIEKMAEANLHINALCMAFYARSEEARRSHSAHKLALGALALEDALSKGFPIQTEIEALRNYLKGIDQDSILDLVLSSLPDETRKNGTDTLLQLSQKFDSLKGTLRHFSQIPPGGGGILAHSLAHVASSLKVKEDDQSGDGIESVINKVEGYLAEGKIIEAANALEEGVQGTQAREIVGDWLRHARNRAITEQALTLLQSYATSISLT